MPTTADIPKPLRPFVFHGVSLSYSDKSPQATGECPFCGKPKLHVNPVSGLWDCKVCLAKGNPTSFLWQLHEASKTKEQSYRSLADQRKLLNGETLAEWGLVVSDLTGEWLVPGYSPGGKIGQLYRYVLVNGRSVLYATPGLNHGLYGANLYDPKKGDVYLCEGPWDGMALWEALGLARWKEEEGGEVAAATSLGTSLRASSNVLAVPGCGVFLEQWAGLFGGKRVFLLYDNDHPKVHPKTGKVIGSGALVGMRKVAEILTSSSSPPLEVHYLCWGNSIQHNPELPNGYDVRDCLADNETWGLEAAQRSTEGRVAQLGILLSLLQPVPDDWVKAPTSVSSGGAMECLPCDSWKVLTDAWRKAMKWTDGLDRALAVMLAAVTSTKAVGDQLWVKIISPPSSGKSVLCEALSVNRKYVFPKDTLTGMFSGFQTDKEGSEDFSLAAKIKNKTLAIKDGDTVLQAPNKGQILSQLRAMYDRSVRTSYGNRMSRDYEGHSVTVILCGTSSLRQLDTSELGERFLDCVIVDEIDDELEDEIALRKAYQAVRDTNYEVDGKPETREGPEMVKAKQLTGGYVEYLRENAQTLLSAVEVPDEMVRRCTHLGKFIAFMRARPSAKQEEKAEREMSFRLVSQIVRLARCLAVVLNRDIVDDRVMVKVAHVAMDTARGRTLDIVRHLYTAGKAGMETGVVAHLTNHTDEKERVLLRFLRKIGVVELFVTKSEGRLGNRPRWRLTDRLTTLFTNVHTGE